LEDCGLEDGAFSVSVNDGGRSAWLKSGESMEPSSIEKVVWSPVYLETILVPTDLRPDSKVALSFALALAQKFEANLVLLHVFAESYSSDTEIGAGAGRLLDATREDAEREVARLEKLLRAQYPKCRRLQNW